MKLLFWLELIVGYLVLALLCLAPFCLKKEPIAPPEKEGEE
jgi:hypothetical protein